MFKKWIIILFLSFSGTCWGQTQLPGFFSNNMVLQQKEKVSIWGQDLPNTHIRLSGSWGEKATTQSNEEGKWKAQIPTPEAGGPYTLQVTGSQKIILSNVMIGEVWLCSGQSNMRMPVEGFINQPVNNSNEAILDSKNHQIRLFHIKRNASIQPLRDVKGQWTLANPSTVKDFSATAYFFGRKLEESLDVPIGLIHTSWGASRIEAWMGARTLSDFPTVQIPRRIPMSKKQKEPTLLYNAMLHPFVGYNLKGVIWYQGESNRAEAQKYKKLFPAMIRSWRDQWQQGKFPFYFVQIAPFNYKKVNSAFLREAQLHTMKTTENTGMAVTLDIAQCNRIHPKEKQKVGERLAYWALSKNYGMNGIAFSGPVYKKMEKTSNGRIKVTFDHATNGLSGFGKKLKGFEIAGEDRVFHPARARINRDKTLSVWSDTVENPVAVRYGFKNCAEATLFNVSGLPASSFRTDEWEE